MQNLFGIIIVIFIVSSIISLIKKNPEVKKFIEDIKKEIKGTTGNTDNSQYVSNTQNRSASTINRTVPNKATNTAVKTEAIGDVRGDRISDREEMHSQLTEMKTIDFETMKSRNQQMGGDGHYHPAGEEGYIEEYDAYSGSLEMSYAGEGCEEHYNLRYISDTPEDDESLQLTSLQKIIVFGEVLNKRKAAR